MSRCVVAEENIFFEMLYGTCRAISTSFEKGSCWNCGLKVCPSALILHSFASPCAFHSHINEIHAFSLLFSHLVDPVSFPLIWGKGCTTLSSYLHGSLWWKCLENLQFQFWICEIRLIKQDCFREYWLLCLAVHKLAHLLDNSQFSLTSSLEFMPSASSLFYYFW